ncbi:hypothetical protein JN531_013040 [Flagellatimonas centrodinii]|uniref:ZIP family metal transporter n=1 Tax=Flagellatimonas centrodinii TaxID=2806210 RepID=UPI001FEEEB95|nr:hypothetical protein [Flagellatimonas centrodinii]ULQ46023.1 hypothetical protein JN531_013040 [Flagellatimonas centrodinii]
MLTTTLLTIVLLSWMAGLSAWLGGLLAHRLGAPRSTVAREGLHAIVGFGGGLLLAAVAFALVPEGMAVLSPPVLLLVFCAGGGLFCLIDAWLARQQGPQAQLLAMLMDFVPEALSLGAVFAYNPRLGMLLAAFIGAQNLPEGFNTYRERVQAGASGGSTLRLLALLSLLGPAAALLGHLLLQDRVALTAGIMSFAGGGILYLIFQDIAPKVPMRRHWAPALGAVAGFAVGMMGKVLLH